MPGPCGIKGKSEFQSDKEHDNIALHKWLIEMESINHKSQYSNGLTMTENM